MQMAKHASDHARDTSDALEEDEPNEPFPFAHSIVSVGALGVGVLGAVEHVLVVSIAGGLVGTPSKEAHHGEGDPIRPSLGVAMSDADATHILFRVTGGENR